MSDRNQRSHHVELDDGEIQLADESIEKQLKAEFRRSPYPAIRTLACHMHHGTVTLRGHVPSYYLKQLAQTVVGHRLHDGVVIRNQVEVHMNDATYSL